MKYQEKIYPFKLELMKAFIKDEGQRQTKILNIFKKSCIFYCDKTLSISYSKKHGVCKLEISDRSFAGTLYNIWQCRFVSFPRSVCQKQFFFERF